MAPHCFGGAMLVGEVCGLLAGQLCCRRILAKLNSKKWHSSKNSARNTSSSRDRQSADSLPALRLRSKAAEKKSLDWLPLASFDCAQDKRDISSWSEAIVRKVGFELFYRALKRADSVAFVPPPPPKIRVRGPDSGHRPGGLNCRRARSGLPLRPCQLPTGDPSHLMSLRQEGTGCLPPRSARSGSV